MLKTGDTDPIRSHLFTHEDLKAVCLDQLNPKTEKDTEDFPQKHNLNEIAKELKRARGLFDFAKYHVSDVAVGTPKQIKVLWSLARIQPTNQIEGMVLGLVDAEGKNRVKVEIGDLLWIEGRWKLDGWIVVSSTAQ
jgi:hypothetical protein